MSTKGLIGPGFLRGDPAKISKSGRFADRGRDAVPPRRQARNYPLSAIGCGPARSLPRAPTSCSMGAPAQLMGRASIWAGR
jgi:hypothetical protein